MVTQNLNPPSSWQPLAVSVKNGYMTYRSGQPVLKNFNMNVPIGTIFSLLGPSGCGKTTVLSSIVGIKSLTGGEVEVFGKRPGTAECGVPGPVLGYMPQGITLYSKFTIRESFLYFGRIYGLPKFVIVERLSSLSSFLDLPEENSRISNLSGGQQRRVSLAVCLLHEPKLLILDEPTVGVDPLLRERIWDYLHRLVSDQKTTVIITTHYVEETRDSHTIGIMRNGRLLVEESPRLLMERYNSLYLEEIVTKLFHDANEIDQEENIVCIPTITPRDSVEAIRFRIIDPETPDEDIKILNFHMPTSNNSQQYKGSTYSRTKALVNRNIVNFVRNPVYFYLFLLLPSMNGIMVHYTVGSQLRDVKLGVINPELKNDLGGCSKQFQKCKSLSCDFINELSSSVITPVLMGSEDEALASVRRGDTRGYMRFPANYSTFLINRIVAGNFADEEFLNNSEVSFRLDHSEFPVGYILRKTIYESMLSFAAKAVVACDYPEKKWVLDFPIKLRKTVYGKDDFASNSAVSSAVLLLITFFIPTMTASEATISDRKAGTMDRTLVAGVSKLEYLVALTITEGSMILVQNFLSYGVGTLLLQWDNEGSHINVVALMFLTGILGTSFGFLLAQFCQEELEAVIIAIGIFVSHVSMTGLLWPLEGNATAVRYLTNMTPLNWSLDVLRSIMVRGWSFAHPKVYPSLAVLISTSVFSAIIAIRLWRRT